VFLVSVQALHPYAASRPDELSFSAGNILTVLKKGSDGWWEAEFNGKRGLIPGNYVADYTPPVQVPVPAPAPAPAAAPAKKQQERKAMVEFNGNSPILQVPVGSLAELTTFLRGALSITTPFTLKYFDSDFNDFGDLVDVSVLPERPKLKIVAQAMSWWSWSVDSTSSWTTKGFETTRYSSLLVKEGTHTHHQPALDKFHLIAAQLGFDPKVATKVFAISNEILLTNFENYRATLYAKHRANPGLFKKEDWLTMSEGQQRKEFIGWHTALSDRFPWNDKTKPRVIPMLQGTSEGAVWQICQQGFGVVGTTDDGFYGAGVYFTSKLGYADKYAKSGADGSKPFLVSMIIPGNTFPVVEHPFATDGSSPNQSGFKGKGCRAGYQSHYTVVDGRDINAAFPLRGHIDDATAADELVTFEGAQALPIFVFYTK